MRYAHRTRLIFGLVYNNKYNRDRYQSYGDHITAMKWKGGLNVRLYCTVEVEGKRKRVIIAKYPEKKTQKVDKKAEALIEAIKRTDYECINPSP
ncbi:MAG: hypothetical protein AAGN35_07455 [Bacteroidota bacterium]